MPTNSTSLYHTSNNGAAAVSHPVAPTANEDEDAGYFAGAIWIETTNSVMYVCVDASSGAAVWTQMGTSTSDFNANKYALIVDQKSAGTDGGTATSGSWETRDLNTELEDAGGIVSISSNQFTLAAGTYLIKASAPAFDCGPNRCKLVEDPSGSPTDVVLGSSENTDTTSGLATVRSELSAVVTPSASTAYEIQHRVTTTKAGSGYGANGNLGAEIYTIVEIWKA